MSRPSWRPGCGSSTPATPARPTPIDAHAVAMAALRTPKLKVLTFDEELVALRLLADRRDELSALRVQTVNRLHRLLTELIPGGAQRDRQRHQGQAAARHGASPDPWWARRPGGWPPRSWPTWSRVDTKLKALNTELTAAVLARGSHLMDLHGIGPAGAARILADVGDVARFPDRNHFASWTGTAPLDASSGDHIRHRLSRAGNRRMNHVLHVAAIAQIRHDTEGRAYYRRKLAAGQDPQGSTALPEATPVRPRLPPARRRRHTAGRPDAGRSGGPGRALGGVSRIQRGRPAHPGHRLFGSATTRTRSTDATRATTDREHPTQPRLPAPAPTRRSRQGGAPHRTNDLDGDKHRRTLQGAETAPLTQRGTRSVRVAAPKSDRPVARRLTHRRGRGREDRWRGCSRRQPRSRRGNGWLRASARLNLRPRVVCPRRRLLQSRAMQPARDLRGRPRGTRRGQRPVEWWGLG